MSKRDSFAHVQNGTQNLELSPQRWTFDFLSPFVYKKIRGRVTLCGTRRKRTMSPAPIAADYIYRFRRGANAGTRLFLV
jgi:hypothetical protein